MICKQISGLYSSLSLRILKWFNHLHELHVTAAAADCVDERQVITKVISWHFTYRAGLCRTLIMLFTETQQFPPWASTWRQWQGAGAGRQTETIIIEIELIIVMTAIIIVIAMEMWWIIDIWLIIAMTTNMTNGGNSSSEGQAGRRRQAVHNNNPEQPARRGRYS